MRIPWLFSRYLAKKFLLAFFAVLFVLAALILLFDVIDLLRRASSRDYVGFLDVVRLGLYKVPQMLPLILPFTILIASVITFLLLSKTHELVIARSAGLSVWNFLTPVFVVVCLIGIVNITLINPFSTAMIRRYQFEEGETLRKKTGFSWNEKGLWLREKMGDDPVIIHADSVYQEGKDLKLTGVLVLNLNTDETLKKQIEAKNGFLSGYTLVVNNGVSYTPDGDREEGIQMHIPTQLDLDKIIQTFDKPEEISFWKLPHFIKLLNNAGFSSLKHRMHFYSTLASIFYFIAMVFIAAMFTLSPNQRQGGILMKSANAILFGFVLFFISRLTGALGMSGTLPIFLAVFGPSVIMIFISASVLLHNEDG
ncbi:MAG: LptF/LptG family permease [Alphaproteobacteria bacterium]|nr:LptF/LptG family permease [Alphaproteobacteria bacterium]